MDAYVKVKGIENLCYVPSIKKIITMSTMNHESSEITGFEALRIYSNWYYVFVGERMLHVWGKNIEFVSFQ